MAKVALREQKGKGKKELQVYYLNTVCQQFTETPWIAAIFITEYYVQKCMTQTRLEMI